MHVEQIQNILTAMTPRYVVQKTICLYRNKVKIKVTLCPSSFLIQEDVWRNKGKARHFYNFALDEGNRSASRSGCLIPVERAPSTY